MKTFETTSPQSEVAPDVGESLGLLVSWGKGTGVGLGLVTMAYLLALGLGDPLLVSTGGSGVTEVMFGTVFGMTMLGAFIGAVLALVARRWAPRPRATFIGICAVAVAGYAMVPFISAETVSTGLWLNLFHLAVAVPVVGFVAGSLPTARR